MTAQKREESLQDVPISVSALSGERIRQTGITKLQDLSVYMPNVQITEATGTDGMFIRGIGSGINMGLEQSVGTVIDGVYYGRSRFSRAQFLDVERVEVSKGPHSILFGKNTTSGIINITTANPTDEFEAWITGAYEFNDDEKTVEGALSGPLTDDLSARVAFRYNELDGYIKNITSGSDDPKTDDWTGFQFRTPGPAQRDRIRGRSFLDGSRSYAILGLYACAYVRDRGSTSIWKSADAIS